MDMTFWALKNHLVGGVCLCKSSDLALFWRSVGVDLIHQCTGCLIEIGLKAIKRKKAVWRCMYVHVGMDMFVLSMQSCVHVCV